MSLFSATNLLEGIWTSLMIPSSVLATLRESEDDLESLSNTLINEVTGAHVNIDLFLDSQIEAIIENAVDNLDTSSFDLDSLIDDLASFADDLLNPLENVFEDVIEDLFSYVDDSIEPIGEDLSNIGSLIGNTLISFLTDLWVDLDSSISDVGNLAIEGLAFVGENFYNGMLELSQFGESLLEGQNVMFDPLELILTPLIDSVMTRFESLFTFDMTQIQSLRTEFDKSESIRLEELARSMQE